MIYRSHAKSIYVSKVDRMHISHRIYVSRNRISKLTVNPMKSLIFWSENNGTDYIMRSNQDMTDVKVIKVERIHTVRDFRIDYKLDRIF
jgi:superfamily II helicase